MRLLRLWAMAGTETWDRLLDRLLALTLGID
jgi:hypothetical protein